MEGIMKSAIFYGVGDVRIEERPIPKIGKKDVLVKILRAGICGSDTAAYLKGGEATGIFPGHPFGHEMVGKIVEKGEDVDSVIEIGQKVFIEPSRATKAGMILTDMLGGFGEYVKVEDAKIDENLFVLDESMDLDQAVLIEPIAVGTKAAVCMEPKVDDHVVILGAGTIGLSSGAALIARGLENVVIVDQNEFRLEKARQIGLKTINTAKVDMNEKLIEYFGEYRDHASNMEYVEPELMKQFIDFCIKAGMDLAGKKPNVDLYIDAAGAFPLLDDCFNHCKHGAKFSIVAVYGRQLEFAGGNFIKNEPIIRGSQAYDIEILQEVIHNVIPKTNIDVIMTKKFKHQDFVEAIETASKGDTNIKVVIDYELD